MATATAALIRVECPRCGRRAGILAGAIAWCWGARNTAAGHPARRMREVTP